MLFWVKLMWWSDSAISTSSRCRYRVWKLKHGAIFIKRDLKRKDNLPPFCSQFHTRMCDSMFRRGGREIAETITMWEKSETWSFKKVKLFDAEASFSQYSADGSLFLRPAVYYNGKSQWPSPPSLVFFFQHPPSHNPVHAFKRLQHVQLRSVWEEDELLIFCPQWSLIVPRGPRIRW